MLRTLSTLAPPIALVLVGVLLVEPPILTPGDRLPTLRVLAGDEHAMTPEKRFRVVLSRLLGPGLLGEERVGAIDLQAEFVAVEWRLNQATDSSMLRANAQHDVYTLLQWTRLVRHAGRAAGAGADLLR